MGCDVAIADACQAAGVSYDDLILTIAAGSYPCLPGAVPGSPRAFDEADLLALYVYGRLLAFGFGALRAGEYACRVHAALRSDPNAKTIAIVLTPHGGKRVVVERDAPTSSHTTRPENIEIDITAIQQSLKTRIEHRCEQ